MSVRSKLEKLIPFKTGDFHITDGANFMSTLCPNELSAFEAWIGLFERCGGFKDRNFESFYLYGFFMDGKTPIETIKAIEMNSKPFDITQHEWSDDVMSVAKGSDKKSLLIKFRKKYNNTAWVDIDDVIGFARALGVTAEDLK